MNRITVTLNGTIEEKLRKIQGALIMGRMEDVNFTTVVNAVLLAGILGTEQRSDEIWDMIRNFFDTEKFSLDLEGQTDHFINKLK